MHLKFWSKAIHIVVHYHNMKFITIKIWVIKPVLLVCYISKGKHWIVLIKINKKMFLQLM